MGSGTREAMNAGGMLAEVPLPHALLYVRAKRLTGVLDLRAPNRRHGWVVFHRGSVVSVSTTPTMARFGAVAYELGLIDGPMLEQSMIESTHARKPVAELLLERGVLTAVQHRTVLEEQACRRVHHMFTYPDSTRFTFRESRPSGTTADVLVDVLAPVWRALVDFPPHGRIKQVLSVIGARPLRLASGAALELERARLDAEERVLCGMLADHPHTVQELRAASRLPPARVDLLAYMLVVSRSATPDGEGEVAAPSREMWAVKEPARDAPPAKSVSTKMEKVRGPKDLGAEGIRARAFAIATETPYQTLSLPEGATAEAARAAFVRLSRLWHPDRLPPELEEVRTAVELVFARMTEAHRLLTRASAAPPGAAGR